MHKKGYKSYKSCRVTQQSDDPKHAKEATKQFLWHILDWKIQSPDLSPFEHMFHLLQTRLKGKTPQNKEEERWLQRGLAEHHKGRYKVLRHVVVNFSYLL